MLFGAHRIDLESLTPVSSQLLVWNGLRFFALPAEEEDENENGDEVDSEYGSLDEAADDASLLEKEPELEEVKEQKTEAPGWRWAAMHEMMRGGK